jgi:hypothetical protein
MGVQGKNKGNFVVGRMSSDNLNTATVTITNAQMLTLRASPITLVAAQGAGTVIELVGGQLFLDASGAVYTESTDNLAVRYVDGSGIQVSEDIESTGFVTVADEMATSVVAKKDAIATDAQCVNQVLVLHNTGDGELGGGNSANEMICKISYRVHASGF